jgi:hypothetical protein
LTLLEGCSVNWNGLNPATIDVPSGECVDLTYTAPGNDGNGYFFTCANKTALGGSNCYRGISVGESYYLGKSGACNESVNSNTVVNFNVTGASPNGGSFTKEGIIIEAFNATIDYVCLVPGSGEQYFNNLSTQNVGGKDYPALCGGGVVHVTGYSCPGNYNEPPSNVLWAGYTSACNPTHITSYQCVPDAVQRSQCSSGYARTEITNKQLINVDFTCKMRSGNGDNW